MGRLFCVTTVSIVCAIKAPVPVRAADGLDPPYLNGRDAADGADGGTQLVLVYCRYPDCARSEPPLAARESAVGVATIRRAELAESETSMTAANDLSVRRALEAAGVEFIDEAGGGPGVRLRKRRAKKA